MEAIQSAMFSLLFLISISVEIPGIHVGGKDPRYSTLRDQHVIVLDSSERYRRQAPILSNLTPSQNSWQTEGTKLVAANTTRNDENRTISAPHPTTITPSTTVVINDTHDYYTSTVMQNQADTYWVELSNATLCQELRNSSMKAKTIQFQNSSFLFYGHQIYNVTISTGGFLYMSPFVHTFLTATQYTAPLMAGFGTMGNNSDIYFQEYDNQFIVEWRNVYLVDKGDVGPFKFETILHKNGSIAFIYQKVPVPISTISTSNHPVKIGLADAYYSETKNWRGQIMRLIYNYHTIKVNFTNVKPKTVIMFHPLTTCNLVKDCSTCVAQKTAFKCLWYAKLHRCSDSFDWYQQEWIQSGCNVEGHNSSDLCNGTISKPTSNASTTSLSSTTETPEPNNKTLSTKTQSTPTPSPTITPVPVSSTTGLATNQTIIMTSPRPTLRQLTTTKNNPETTILRDLPINITTPQTTNLKKETSQISVTNSTKNSTKITTLKPNATTYQTTKTTLPSSTPHKLTTIETIPPTTTLMTLTSNITTSQTTTLRQEISQMLTTNMTTTTINSTKITTTLKPNTTTYQTAKTTSPNSTSHKSTTIETTTPTTTLIKLATNITTPKTTTLRQETSQMLTTNTTTATTNVAPCNKTKNGTYGQGLQPSTQSQVSQGSSNAPMIAMVIVLVLIALGTLIGFLVYAYRNPTSAPGQWLIKYCPSTLRERVRNVRDNIFKSFSDSSEKYRLEKESEL